MTSGGNNVIDFPHQGVPAWVTRGLHPLEGVCIKATSGVSTWARGVYTH